MSEASDAAIEQERLALNLVPEIAPLEPGRYVPTLTQTLALAQVHATLAVANAMLAVAAELDWANTNRRD